MIVVSLGVWRVIAALALVSIAMSGRAERVVVALGTSFTAGSAWPDELESGLQPCFPEGVRLERIAAAGKTSAWGKNSLRKVISTKPNVVMIEFAINDADLRDGMSLARSRANHEAIIDRLLKAVPGVRLALVTTNPAYGPRGWIRPNLRNYYAMYRQLTVENGLMLIDLHAHWQSALASEDHRRLIPDGLHPSDEAIRNIALPKIRKAVVQMLSTGHHACE